MGANHQRKPVPEGGRSLELYYIDGRPDGMLTAEMFGWTGKVLMAPRTQLAEALARPESGYAGIYLLLGEKDDQPLLYIGEGEDVGARIRSHDVRKDWWTSVVFVTSAANQLNKAHAKYLEARLIQDAMRIGRTPLDNLATPATPGLSEADIGKMEAFLANLFMVLPAVRIDAFVQRARPAPQPAPMGAPSALGTTSPRFTLVMKQRGVKASAVLQDGEFIVEAGSHARLDWGGAEATTPSYAVLHAELRRAGIIVQDGELGVFAQNYAFRSPSAAACIVTGRSANGPLLWKAADGRSYRDVEADQISTQSYGLTPGANITKEAGQ